MLRFTPLAFAYLPIQPAHSLEIEGSQGHSPVMDSSKSSAKKQCGFLDFPQGEG